MNLDSIKTQWKPILKWSIIPESKCERLKFLFIVLWMLVVSNVLYVRPGVLFIGRGFGQRLFTFIRINVYIVTNISMLKYK